jgi:hypothetical protein
MGTSVSFRSPNRPRWNAVIARIKDGDSPEAIRAELFNAGLLDGWAAELSRPAIGHYAEAVVEAHATFAHYLSQADQPEAAIQDVVNRARARALAEDNAPAVAVVERALARTLIAGSRGEGALADSTPEEASAAWVAQRGDRPADLIQRFLGEVLHQYTAHVVARDAGKLLGHPRFERATDVRRLERELSAKARDMAAGVEVSGTGEQLAARWEAFVHQAFKLASALQRPDE